MSRLASLLLMAALAAAPAGGACLAARTAFTLDEGWCSVCYPEEVAAYGDSLVAPAVSLPHNWDDYYGCRQLVHGNLHGRAVYDLTFAPVVVAPSDTERMARLTFEGAGTYLTVVLNGDTLCSRRPAGRVTTTLDVPEGTLVWRSATDDPALTAGRVNRLRVVCDHPSLIADMPWVCGGCSSEWGFSEGSQPFGLFRPARLELVDRTHIEPFGIHVWTDPACDTLYVETDVANDRRSRARGLTLTATLHRAGEGAHPRAVATASASLSLAAGERRTVRQAIAIGALGLDHWSPDRPALYVVTARLSRRAGSFVAPIDDEASVETGFRSIRWPEAVGGRDAGGERRFLIDGTPVYLNGVCEYEHQFGASHALTEAEIRYRVGMIRRAGFNALRDAHQPHNLRYQLYLNRMGIVWWPQFSAHVWYDTPLFRHNFKTLLRQWVRERRNDPALVLWGLQNESTLPADFAAECCAIVREMDPTCRQPGAAAEGPGACGRLITTCNGGSGTDWNVVQNWSGTYGGDVSQYGRELSRPDQLLNGEYGAWRTLGLHDPAFAADSVPPFTSADAHSEDRFTRLLLTKMELAEAAADSLCGQFLWLLSSHDNPGRQQPDEALRVVDKVGPFNNKGLFTPWWQPTQAYFAIRDRHVRRMSARTRATAVSADAASAGSPAGPRVLEPEAGAEPDGMLSAASAARDDAGGVQPVTSADRPAAPAMQPTLEGTVDSPVADVGTGQAVKLLRGAPGMTYLYRYNCGGDSLVDASGQLWMGDDTRYSTSWAQRPQFRQDSLLPVLASQGVVDAPLTVQLGGHPVALAEADQAVLSTFRWGRQDLRFLFPVSSYQSYTVELYFVEPWMDLRGARIFDIAVNGRTVVRNLDPCRLAGDWHRAVKLSLLVATDSLDYIDISFPHVGVGQAVVSAIAISTLPEIAAMSDEVPRPEGLGFPYSAGLTWASLCAQTRATTPKEMLPPGGGGRPAVDYSPSNHVAAGQTASSAGQAGTTAGQTSASGGQPGTTAGQTSAMASQSADGTEAKDVYTFDIHLPIAQEYALRLRYQNPTGSTEPAVWRLLAAADGREVARGELLLPLTPPKWKMVSTTTGGYVNAGDYRLVLTCPAAAEVSTLTVQ